MGNKKIIIHPGIGKTATSAIQKNLFNMCSNDSSKFIYPDIGMDSECAHHFFADNYPHFEEQRFYRDCDRLLELAGKANEKGGDLVCILSSEFLIHSSKGHIDALISRLKEGYEIVEVFFTIRSKPELIYSSYLQGVKVNYGVKNGESITDYAGRMGDGFNFKVLFKKWSSVDSLKFMEYKNKSSFVSRFVSHLGLSSENVECFESNISIIEDVVNIVFNFDSDGRNREQRRVFIDNMLDFSYKYKSLSSRRLKDELFRIYHDEWIKELLYLKENYHEIT